MEESKVQKNNDAIEKVKEAKKNAQEARRMPNCALFVAIVGIAVAILANLDRIVIWVNWLRAYLNL